MDLTNGNRFQSHEDFPHWEQNFARVPTIGEYILRDGKGLTVKSVTWHDSDNPLLIVESGTNGWNNLTKLLARCPKLSRHKATN